MHTDCVCTEKFLLSTKIKVNYLFLSETFKHCKNNQNDAYHIKKNILCIQDKGKRKQ